MDSIQSWPTAGHYLGYKEQKTSQLHGSRTKKRASMKGRVSVYKKESLCWLGVERNRESGKISVVTGEVSEIQKLLIYFREVL